MKKIIMMIGVLLLLTGCGKSGNFTLELGSRVIDKNLSNMTEIADSTLTDAYNLDLSKMNEYVFKQNTEGDFYAIIKTDKQNEVKSEMKEYFRRVKDFNESYSPERLELLEDRLEKQLDEYLIYIIANDADEIYDEILEELD